MINLLMLSFKKFICSEHEIRDKSDGKTRAVYCYFSLLQYQVHKM